MVNTNQSFFHQEYVGLQPMHNKLLISHHSRSLLNKLVKDETTGLVRDDLYLGESKLSAKTYRLSVEKHVYV